MAEENGKKRVPGLGEEAMGTGPLADNLKEAEKSLENIRSLATEAMDTFGNVSKNIKETAKGGYEFSNAMNNSANLVADINKSAEKLSGINKENLAKEGVMKTFLKEKERLKTKMTELDSQIKFLTEARVNASEEEVKAINKTLEGLTNSRDQAAGLARSFEEIEEANTKINKESKFFDNMSEFTNKIPGMGKLFGEFGNAAKAAREAAAEGGNAFAAGAKQMTGAFGKLATGFFIGKFITGLKEGDERIVELSRNLNMSRERADELNKEFNRIGRETPGLVGADIMKATTGVSDALGISAKLSKETSVAFATATKKLGLTVEQASNLNNLSAATGTNLQDFNNSLITQVKLQNDAQGSAVRYQDVMKDVAGASAATQLTTSKFSGGIGKAAFQARKLGMNMNQLNQAGEQLLDFEESIGAEMEAELLLGRDLNLDRARMAALTGDQATLAAELAKNVGSSAEFSKMNVIQQNALAKSMGMSRDELAQTLINQEAMAKFSDVEGQTLDEKLKNRYAEIEAMEDSEAKAKAMAKLEKDMGDSETLRQLKNATMAEAQKEAMQQMAEAVQDLAKHMQHVTNFFKQMAEVSTEIFGFIGKFGSKFMAIGKSIAEGLVKPIGKAFKGISKFGKFLGGGIFKSAGKMGFKSLLKKIPILGALVGIGLAYKRFKDGDIFGAGAELLSGIVSIFPGIGTAASVAIDAGLAARDMGYIGDREGHMAETKKRRGEDVNVDAEDFTIKTHPADTLTMAGGTKLGGEVENLLKELIATVKSGGHVYLDGSRVGQTLTMNAKLSN